MSDPALGLRFDSVAATYDRTRPGYPAALVERALAVAGLGPGASVLEIGCGTGLFTEALLARGLRVEALDPGLELLAFALRRTAGLGDVSFRAGRFEDVALPERAFDAVCSATAFHWVDPKVGWRRAAAVLRPHGALVLLSHVIVFDEWSRATGEGVTEVYRRAIPGLPWRGRTPDELAAGAEARRENVSALWSWFDGGETAPEAGELFAPPWYELHPWREESTYEELVERQRTTATHLSLDAARRDAVERDLAALADRLGTFRQSYVAVAAVARRS